MNKYLIEKKGMDNVFSFLCECYESFGSSRYNSLFGKTPRFETDSPKGLIVLTGNRFTEHEIQVLNESGHNLTRD
jgi:hypothetical protein